MFYSNKPLLVRFLKNALCLATALALIAGVAINATAGTRDIETRRMVGPMISYMRYNRPEPDMLFAGYRYGVQGTYTQFSDNFFLDARGHLLSGDMTFTNDRDNEFDAGTNLFAEGRVVLGKPFSDGGRVFPYTGIGYSWWSDHTDGEGAEYRRTLKRLYAPVGIAYAPQKTNAGDWTFTILGEYRHLIRGEVVSEFSDRDFIANDVVFTQTDGEGYSLRVDATNDVYFTFGGEPVTAQLELTYWDIEDSDERSTLYGWDDSNEWNHSRQRVEFANETTEVNISIAIPF